MTIETMILVPVIFWLIYLAVAAGQIAYVRSIVQQQAQEAVRTATLSASGPKAQTDANNAITEIQGFNGLFCIYTSNPLKLTAFALTHPGASATGAATMVSLTVICQIDLSYIPLPGLNSAPTITVTAYSPLDPYRCRYPRPGVC